MTDDEMAWLAAAPEDWNADQTLNRWGETRRALRQVNAAIPCTDRVATPVGRFAAIARVHH